jgi:hypothetical protein
MKSKMTISVFILIVIALAIGVFISVQLHLESPVTVEPKVETAINISNTTVSVVMSQDICESCHLSGKKYIPQAYEIKQHVEGTLYCLKCHTIDHKIHPINMNVTCERCHGNKNPQIPSISEGSNVCGECHNYPDPLKPSYGNLIVIHRPRNVDCKQCHIDSTASCLKCHNEIKKNEKWDTRLNHLNSVS